MGSRCVSLDFPEGLHCALHIVRCCVSCFLWAGCKQTHFFLLPYQGLEGKVFAQALRQFGTFKEGCGAFQRGSAAVVEHTTCTCGRGYVRPV